MAKSASRNLMEDTNGFINLATTHPAGQDTVNMFFPEQVFVSESLLQTIKDQSRDVNGDLFMEVANLLASLQNSLNRLVPGRKAEFITDQLFRFSVSFGNAKDPMDVLCEFGPTTKGDFIKLFFESEHQVLMSSGTA